MHAINHTKKNKGSEFGCMWLHGTDLVFNNHKRASQTKQNWIKKKQFSATMEENGVLHFIKNMCDN